MTTDSILISVAALAITAIILLTFFAIKSYFEPKKSIPKEPEPEYGYPKWLTEDIINEADNNRIEAHSMVMHMYTVNPKLRGDYRDVQLIYLYNKLAALQLEINELKNKQLNEN